MKSQCSCGCGNTVIHNKLYPSQIKRQGAKRFINGHQHIGKKHTKEHISKTRRPMEKNGRWKGGKFIDTDGYVLIKKPGHPFSNNQGYVREHRLVVEEQIGRYITKKEVVHHINHIKNDNRIENLRLKANQSEHIKECRTGRKFPRKDGFWVVCENCKKSFYRSNHWKNKGVRWCSWSCRYKR